MAFATVLFLAALAVIATERVDPTKLRSWARRCCC